jgi:hypothetical protein
MSITNGLIISLTPTHLSAASVRRSRIHQAESIRLDPGVWSDQWSDGLMRLDQPLRQLLSRFSKVSRGSVVLIYNSPTLTNQISSYDQGGAVSRETARAKIREVVGLNSPVCVHELSAGSGSDAKSLVLAYSDRDETLRALYAWLNRCGVRVSGMIPASVVSNLLASEQAAKLDSTTALFFLDSYSSVLCYSDDQGNLKLVRPADIGYEKLTESYRSVLNDYAERCEDESQASKYDVEPVVFLFKYGIPFQPQQFEDVELRSSVLPRMAPALQRMGIDVKQTIRFGIGNAEELKNLVVAGPGAAIPEITKAFGEHLELKVDVLPGGAQFDPAHPSGQGSTSEAFLEISASIPTLLPRIADEERTNLRLKKAMITGGAIACAVMGGQYLTASMAQSKANQNIQAESARIDKVTTFEKARTDIVEVQGLLANLAGLVSENATQIPCWEAPLGGLAKAGGRGIRIQEMRGEFDDKSPVLIINGYSVSEGELEPGLVLDRFVERLNQIDHVKSVQLGATNRIELSMSYGDDPDDAEWGSQFTLRVVLESYVSPYDSLVAVESDSEDWIKP